MTLGDALRAKRKHYGLTLTNVARQTGLSVSYVCDIEHGRRTCPPHTAARLARAVHADPERFIEMVLAEDLDGLGLEVVVRKKFRGVP